MRGGRGAGDGVIRSTQGAFHVLVLPVLFSASWAVSFEAALLVSECRGENWHEMSLIIITEDKCVSHSVSSHA